MEQGAGAGGLGFGEQAGAYGGNGNGGGGESDGGDGTVCAGNPDGCVSSCGVEYPGQTALTECVNGAWRCPDGMVAAHSCPPGSCTLFDFRCCDPVSGARTFAPCEADGLRHACPVGTNRSTNGACIPDALGVSSCQTLDDAPCSTVGMRCSDGVVCTCVRTGADSGGIWLCEVIVP